MTLVTYPPLKKSKKVGDLFEDRNTNVVTLPSHLRCNGECGLRLSIARASSALRSPCTSLALGSGMALTTRRDESNGLFR